MVHKTRHIAILALVAFFSLQLQTVHGSVANVFSASHTGPATIAAQKLSSTAAGLKCADAACQLMGTLNCCCPSTAFECSGCDSVQLLGFASEAATVPIFSHGDVAVTPAISITYYSPPLHEPPRVVVM